MHGRGTHLAFADAGNTFQLAIIVVFRGWGRRHPIGLMTRAAWPSPRSWHPIMDPIMEKKSKKKKHDDRLIARDSETDLTVSQCWIRGMNAVMVSDIILRGYAASQFVVAQSKQLLLPPLLTTPSLSAPAPISSPPSPALPCLAAFSAQWASFTVRRPLQCGKWSPPPSNPPPESGRRRQSHTFGTTARALQQGTLYVIFGGRKTDEHRWQRTPR